MKRLKYLLGIFIFSFVGICFGNFINAGYTRQIGIYGVNPISQGYDINFTRTGNPLTQNLGYTKQFFLFSDGQFNADYNRFFWFWYDGLPYLYMYNNWYNGYSIRFVQGNIVSYSLCDEITSIENSSMPGNCSVSNVGDTTPDIIGNFLKTLTNNDYYYFDSSSSELHFCISNSSVGKSFCFGGSTYYENLVNSLGLSDSVNFDSIDISYLENPPGYNGGGDEGGEGGSNIGEGGISIGSDESAINYFENRYGRNENICYVGVDNMTDLWGSTVSFYEGTGLTIFEAFETLYGNADLDKVYVWINSWLINYGQWFGRNGDPLYLASYNSGTNQVDLRYENLTFPFSNNPVAVYFMSDYMTRNSEYDTMGSEIVSYCNLKINDGSFDDIIDQSTKNNIDKYTGQSNINKGLNFDGSPKVFTGPFLSLGGTGFSSDHWGDKEGNTDLKGFFDNAMDEMQSVWENGVQNPFTGILPNWLIYSLIVVILFKLLRK